MNETLCRALVQARLTEEDVATHLQVDPKTVRRWLEGRTPYLRHRWALAALLGLDEADLWPQLRTARSRPEEVRAIYPHAGDIPQEVWQEFFQSAQHEIGILANSDAILAMDQGPLDALRDRAELGIRVLICLRMPDSPLAGRPTISMRHAPAPGSQLPTADNVEIRLHRSNLTSSIYRADDELIVGHRAFGIPARATPALHLRGVRDAGLMAMYIESFYNSWSNAAPIGQA